MIFPFPQVGYVSIPWRVTLNKVSFLTRGCPEIPHEDYHRAAQQEELTSVQREHQLLKDASRDESWTFFFFSIKQFVECIWIFIIIERCISIYIYYIYFFLFIFIYIYILNTPCLYIYSNLCISSKFHHASPRAMNSLSIFVFWKANDFNQL